MKYKLIKEYPGSPKLGTITDRTMYFPEYYPSFWQPVVEKGYETLSLVASEKNPQHKKGSKFLHNKDYKFKNMHPTEFWDIYSVKRLSDGEIFTIGDIIDTRVDNKYKQEILEISIKNNTIMFRTKLGFVILSVAKKVKKPLFTTEQRSEIEEIIKNIIKYNSPCKTVNK